MGNYFSKTSEPESLAPERRSFSLIRGRYSKKSSRKSYERKITKENDSSLHGKKLNDVNKSDKTIIDETVEDGKSTQNSINPVKVPEVIIKNDHHLKELVPEASKFSYEHPNQITKNESNKKPPKMYLDIPNEINSLAIGRPNQVIMRRMESLIETSHYKSEKPINVPIRDPLITLDKQFLGKDLVNKFQHSFQNESVENKTESSKEYAISCCKTLIQIGVIKPVENTGPFEPNAFYKWVGNDNFNVLNTPLPNRLTFSFEKVSSGFCSNCKKSLNNLDEILPENVAKARRTFSSQSSQTEEINFNDEIPKNVHSTDTILEEILDIQAEVPSPNQEPTTDPLSTLISSPPVCTSSLPLEPNSIPVPPLLPPHGADFISGPPPPLPPPHGANSVPGPPLPPSFGANSVPGPPLPPSFGGPPLAPNCPSAQQSLRKKPVKPNRKMKVLFWKPIKIPLNNEPSKGKLWLEVPDSNLENVESFVELFENETKTTTKKVEPIKKRGFKKVLDSKRSQNVGIVMRKYEIEKILNALCNCDEKSGLTAEDLLKIDQMKATTEEMEKLNDVEDSENLDGPEAWLLELSKIDFLSDRVFCIVVQSEFDEKFQDISIKLSVVNSLCKFFMENDNLKKLLAIILAAGNYLNGGNVRGQADGFGLEILGKLKDIKSNNPKITLLHYIVQAYFHKCRKGVSLDNIESPIPDPFDVDKATNIDFAECEREMKKLSNDIQSRELSHSLYEANHWTK